MRIVIDDGPSPLTEIILDTLSRFDQHATFGIVGEYARDCVDVLRRMVADGHEIANHSMTHSKFAYMSEEQVLEDIERAQDAITVASGVTPTLCRPPYVRQDPHILRAIRRAGLEPLLGFSVGDYAYDNPDELVLACKNHSDFLGLHELPVTVRALPAILVHMAVEQEFAAA